MSKEILKFFIRLNLQVAIVNYLADGLTAEGLRRQPPKYLMTNRTVPKYGKQAKWNLKSMPDNALLSRGVLYFG